MDRSIVVERSITETPHTGHQAIKIMMGWELTDKTYETCATNSEIIVHAGEDSDTSYTLCVERSEFLDGLDGFGLSAGDTDFQLTKVTRFETPSDDLSATVAWRTAAMGIMVALRPELRKFERQLDCNLDALPEF
jgi:hypothetical protein